jgi:hypothetical protein
MFTDVLKEVTSVIDRRFLMNAFFPSLIFWGLLITAMIAGRGDLLHTARSWNEQEELFKALQIIGFIAWVTFFASVMSTQMTAILRLYEGYWNFPLGKYLRAAGQNKHKKYLEKLKEEMQKDTRRYNEIYLYYPFQTEQVMPTLLGNILKNAEQYPLDRYDIDAVLIWPRLYSLLPERIITSIADARGELDFMLVISSLSGTFALLSAGSLLIISAAKWQILVCFLSGLLVSWLAYRGALGSAIIYAQQIKATFDLYRNELLKQMRLPLPATPKVEEKLWHDVCQFLYRNSREEPELWKYTDAISYTPPKREEENAK